MPSIRGKRGAAIAALVRVSRRNETNNDSMPADRTKDVVKARLVLVMLSLGWGITWPFMRIALTEIPPFSMRVATTCLGALTLSLLAHLQGRSLAIKHRTDRVHVFVAAQCNIVAFSIFTPFAQLSAATSRVAIVVYTMPIWASLLAWPILDERLSTARAAALVLCAIGMAVLIYPLATAGVPGGILLALGAAVSWAAGTVYLKWARIDADPMAIAVWQLVVGCITVSACLSVFEGELHLWPLHAAPLLSLLFIGLIGSGIAYFLWFDLVRRVPAMTASLGVLSAPVIGVVSSVMLLGEWPTHADMVGFALIFAASACVVLWP